MSNILITNANPRTAAAGRLSVGARPENRLSSRGPRLAGRGLPAVAGISLPRTRAVKFRKRFRWKGGWNEHRRT